MKKHPPYKQQWQVERELSEKEVKAYWEKERDRWLKEYEGAGELKFEAFVKNK